MGSCLWPHILLTFSTSVGLASAEEITPETTPQITLINNVSSATKKRMSDSEGLKGRCTDCTEQARSSGKNRKGKLSNHMVKLHKQKLATCNQLKAELSPQPPQLPEVDSRS